MTATLSLRELERVHESREVEQVEEQQRMVRCSLSKDAKHRVDLSWMQGKGYSPERLYLDPGKSKTLPLERAQVHFGPFAHVLEYASCTDERRREKLWATIQAEKHRILSKYDYERPLSKGKDGYEATGPHRFPDVTVTVLNSDGSESEPIRLHALYEIGEFDPLKDSYNRIETIASIKSQAEQEKLDAAAEIEKLRRTAAEALGMVKGVVAATAGK